MRRILWAGLVVVVVLGVPPGVGQAAISPPDAGPAAAVSEVARAVAAAHASGRRVEVLSQRTAAQEVFAEPDGTFTARLHAVGPARAGETRHAAAASGGDFPPPGAGWAKVFSGKPDQAYWNGGPDGPVAKVGQCYNDGTCNGIGIARTYVQFDIRALHGATILNIPGQTSGAEFNAHEVYAPSCNGGGRDIAVDLEHVLPFGEGLTWRNQQSSFPGAIGGPRAEMHGYNASCGPAWIGWGVGDQVRYSNDVTRTDYVAFMLHANNEGEQLAWKKLDGFTLLVHYDWPPNAPSSPFISAGTKTVACSTDPTNPNYVNNAASPLTLRTVATDPDPADSLWTEFEWADRGGGRVGGANPGPLGNGSEFTAQIPAATFADGRQLSWHARSGDGRVNGPWGPQTGSGWCQVDIDNTAPAVPEVQLSASQPPSTAGSPVTFIATSGDPGVVSFRYGLTQGGGTCTTPSSVDSQQVVSFPGGQRTESASIAVTPLKAATWDLWVAAVDRADNVGACRNLRFSVLRGRGPVAQWRLDGGRDDTAVPDSSAAHAHNGTVAAGPYQWVLGRLGDALRFDGSADSYVAPGGGPAVRTDQSFSVAAWVRLDRSDGVTHAAVSQDGGTVPGFLLGYLAGSQRFAFQLNPTDAVGSAVAVPATAAPRVGAWTHLIGVYDAPAHETRLYVDGVLQGTAPVTVSWNATGGVQIGRSKSGGGYTGGWVGALDEVRVYDRVLTDVPSLEPADPADPADPNGSVPRSEIDRLATPPVEEADYPLDRDPGDISGNYRTVVLSGDASWVPGRVGGGAFHVAGAGAAATAGPAVRTSSSFTLTAVVKLETVDGGTHTAVSQDGFALQYRGDTGKWAFRLPDGTTVTAKKAPVANQWAHLAGVYDAGAGALRIYVDAALEGSASVASGTPDTTGPLVLGRGAGSEWWAGAIDEVHAYTGVPSDPQLAALSGQTDPSPPSLYSGAFERFAGDDGRHYAGPGPVPPGYHLEGVLGYAAPVAAANTQMVYSCRYSGGFFLDLSDTCADHEVLGPAGLMYSTPPPGVPTQAVYRCVVLANGDHFISNDAGCESTSDHIRNEGTLGYTRLYAPLIRFSELGGTRWTSATGGHQPGIYTAQARLGYVSMTDVGQTLYVCLDGADEYLSTAAACEGGQKLGTTGWVWPTDDLPPGAATTAPLFGCRDVDGDRFESLDRFCEGAPETGQPLGYVITEFGGNQ
ncbi:LamG-like jellyroll fold domain-containing protein [Rugosimonospora africana]|uniref:LamG-like jellyroll fold domain-containing protein n=1 Tax=Rugosimonospora africana TaxID=556532 RepID=A0A8J3QS36_9ACTN|nr:LamG-like jellyroll fold domain-containing protein [Rugosimonospora africana]GIH14857.1 hypothetical protein Raf01_30290 [Rugosimonospora africana]